MGEVALTTLGPGPGTREEISAEGQTVVVVAGTPSKWRSLHRLQDREQVLAFLWCPETASKVLEWCRKLAPCVLLVDEVFLSDIDPVRFSELTELGRSVRVLVRSAREDPEFVERSLRLGCVGVLRSDCSVRALRRALRAVAEGELWANRKTLSRLVQALLLKDRCGLTEREEQIFQLVGQGCHNEEIAKRLFISPQTVRWHLRSLYAKLGVHSRRRPELYAIGKTDQAFPARQVGAPAKPPLRATTPDGSGTPRLSGKLSAGGARG